MSLPPFELVVEEYGPTVLKVCRAVLAAADAEDAAAETFLAAMKAYPRLRPGSNVKGWLVTIAYRKAVDVIRRSRDVPHDTVDVITWDEEPPDRTVWAIVRQLPDKQRMAVAYRYMADLSYAEIGGLMDTSEAAARRNTSDGLRSLKKRMETDR